MNGERNTLTQEREGLVFSTKVGGGASTPDFTYKTSAALIENITAKRETEETGDLFGDIQEGGAGLPAAEYCDRNGKRVNLSPLQLKIVAALAEKVDELVFSKGRPAALEEYITDLPALLTKRTEEGGTFPRLKHSELLDIDIDIPSFTKRVRSIDHPGGRDIREITDEIKKLAELQYRFRFRLGDDEELEITSPLYTLGKGWKHTKDGEVRQNRQRIRLEDIFVYDINNRFVLAPHDMLELWNDKGLNSEMFATLFFLLQEVRHGKTKGAREAVPNLRKALRKKGMTDAETASAVEVQTRELLTYRESLSSILKRLGTTMYTQKKKGKNGERTYLRNGAIFRDLRQAADALMNTGIITDYYETRGKDGGVVCNFVLNDKWLDERKGRARGLLPAEEQTTPEEKPTTAQG